MVPRGAAGKDVPHACWLVSPVTDAEREQAYRANAIFDAHRDDPEFGYRFLVDEARDAGQVMAQRTAWRICSENGWWSTFGKKKARGKSKRPGPPVHDDLVQRDVTATGPNQLWRDSPGPRTWEVFLLAGSRVRWWGVLSVFMVELVEMPLEGGGRILFKTTAEPSRRSPSSGPVDASRLSDRVDGLVGQAHESFEQVVDGIAELSMQARDRLQAVNPDEVRLEFGIQVEAGAGMVLASVNSGCHVSVTVTWRADRDGHDHA